MEFTMKEFVPTERKVELIGLTLQEAEVEGIINPMVRDILFKVNTFLVYTTNDLTAEDKSNKFTLFDKLNSKGVLADFGKRMDSNELVYLQKYLEAWTEEQRKYINSVNGILDNFKIFAADIAEKLGTNLNKLDGVNLEQLAQVIPLAKGLGIDLEKK